MNNDEWIDLPKLPLPPPGPPPPSPGRRLVAGGCGLWVAVQVAGAGLGLAAMVFFFGAYTDRPVGLALVLSLAAAAALALVLGFVVWRGVLAGGPGAGPDGAPSGGQKRARGLMMLVLLGPLLSYALFMGYAHRKASKAQAERTQMQRQLEEDLSSGRIGVERWAELKRNAGQPLEAHLQERLHDDPDGFTDEELLTLYRDSLLVRLDQNPEVRRQLAKRGLFSGLLGEPSMDRRVFELLVGTGYGGAVDGLDPADITATCAAWAAQRRKPRALAALDSACELVGGDRPRALLQEGPRDFLREIQEHEADERAAEGEAAVEPPDPDAEGGEPP
jgi:hypothetical protein